METIEKVLHDNKELNELMTYIRKQDEETKTEMVAFCMDYFSKLHAEMTEPKAALAKKRYMKEWRAKHKDRQKIYDKRFWSKKANE